jgi:hypothetical protein
MPRLCPALLAALALLLSAATAAPAQDLPLATPLPTPGQGCLPGGGGYFRARIRGALNLDINWHNAELECQGGPRPDGSGVRVSFAGPPHGGKRLRLVFGLSALQEGRNAHDLPTNLTVIMEGEQRLFATRGDDHCTVDDLRQERLPPDSHAPQRAWRIVARGFCIAPASTLNSDASILVSRFDFAGTAVFEDPPRPQLYPPRS